jgi:hypothetical protein
MLSVSDAAATCGLFHEYQAMIEDRALFERALQSAARSGEGAGAEGVSLQGLLVLLDVALEMLAEAGLQQLHSVYKAVKRHSSVHFERCMLWQTCHLSGASVRGCLKLGDGVFVHPQHAKWVLCLWLLLHLREQERMRDTVPAEHVAIYWAATKCVLEQLEGAYAHLAAELKKNNVVACGRGGRRAHDDPQRLL